jgi:F0F1-type ATP synthase assembly protein I
MDTAEQVISHGTTVQTESIASLARTTEMLAETKGIAHDVAVVIETNTEQITTAYDDLYEIDNELKKSIKIMKRIGRDVFSNKYLWFLIVLIIIGGILCVLVSQGKI